MDPIGSINYKKDSSLAMLWAAQNKGWSLYYIEPQNLFQRDGVSFAQMNLLKVFKDPNHWYEVGEVEVRPLHELDVILMRQDPPFDLNFLYATHILEQAERVGTLVVNRAQSIRDANEKLFATEFPECTTPVLVTRSDEQIRAFIAEQGEVILKPLDGMGGASIFKVSPSDTNTSVIIETLTEHGQRLIMAQKFIPEITSGDKRILLIDGEPVPYALARIPAKGELRGNLAAGGRGEGVPLTARDYRICEQIAPELKKRGLLFVGIDVIGDYLTEINVTSPTCIRELNEQFGLDIAGNLMDTIESKLANK